tara:strand:+ start:30 stop:1037 length:1008 start_codon:yes stop_codon:yes gene_type:complete
MLLKKMLNLLKNLFIGLTFLFYFSIASANQSSFNQWLDKFKITAKKNGISDKTINNVLTKAVYLEKVIIYDNRQPEFFEKTDTYISKRASRRAVKKAIITLKKNKLIFEKVEKEFNVDKEILLALWSTETNFGNNLGKMDIVSSLATLSFDKRRSEFFTGELLTLLRLVDKNIIKKETLFGSWAGALGNFQFMPSSISNHAIDYDKDGYIDLKESKPDAIASAANYINKIGWKRNAPCFDKVEFDKEIDSSFFNHSARNITNKKNLSSWKKMGIKFNNLDKNNNNLVGALVLPDGDASSPKFIVYNNYELILKWNRSLRFGLSICTLAKLIKDEI